MPRILLVDVLQYMYCLDKVGYIKCFDPQTSQGHNGLIKWDRCLTFSQAFIYIPLCTQAVKALTRLNLCKLVLDPIAAHIVLYLCNKYQIHIH